MNEDHKARKAVGPRLDLAVRRPEQERAALLRLPFEMIAALLQLPAGARIDAVLADLSEDRVLNVRVRDSGWITYEGNRIPWATATVTEYRDEDGRCFKRVIDWNLPPNVRGNLATPARSNDD